MKLISIDSFIMIFVTFPLHLQKLVNVHTDKLHVHVRQLSVGSLTDIPAETCQKVVKRGCSS